MTQKAAQDPREAKSKLEFAHPSPRLAIQAFARPQADVNSLHPYLTDIILPYVSITGLELKSPFYAPAFWWHAVRSMRQAYGANGLISAQARKIGTVHHTVTLWESEAAMRAYLVTGAHLGAMKAFHRLATGRTIGFECETPPTWAQVPDLWATKGKVVTPRS